jgi:hypothetical protein
MSQPAPVDPHQAVEPPAVVAVRFFLDAEADPGLLPRLLAPFARRDLTPDRMWSHRNNGTMHVEIALDAMPIEVLQQVEGNLRQVVGLHRLSRQNATTTTPLARAA